MKMKRMIGAALVAVVVGATAFSGVAAADGPNGTQTNGTGWDDVPQTITGGGSDTTYAWHQGAERLYNQAGGCRVDTGSGSANKGKCVTGAAQDQTDVKGNWDHDVTVSAYPTGSSAGVRELTATPAIPGGLYDYARSSRGPNPSGETGTTFWGVGKDAVAVVTFPGRPAANLTTQDIKDIYSCTKTDWSQIGGGAFGSGPIVPVGMNSSSGTYATFQTFLGFDPNSGSCVVGLNGVKATFPFENDVKQLNENAFLNANKGNAIWWMSAAAWKAYGFKRQNAQINTVDTRSPIVPAHVAGNLYPITRFIYHVTRTADAGPVSGSDNVVGATTGKGGAVREFTEFLCKNTANHGLNEFTGLTNDVELSKVYGSTGFFQVPGTQRTNGLCAVTQAP